MTTEQKVQEVELPSLDKEAPLYAEAGREWVRRNPDVNVPWNPTEVRLIERCMQREAQLRKALTSNAKLQAIVDQVEDVLVIDWVTVKDNDYRKALNDLVCHNIQIALDPAVSDDARKSHEELRVLHYALENVCRCLSTLGFGVHYSKSAQMKRAIEYLDSEDAAANQQQEVTF